MTHEDGTTPAVTIPTTSPPLRVRTSVPLAYAVHFTRDLFAPENELLAQVLAEGPEAAPQACLCFVDAGLHAAQPELLRSICEWFAAHAAHARLLHEPLVLPGGEAAKNSFEIPHKVLRLARQLHLSRQAHVLAVGGGAFLDAVGFAVALVHRGARLIRVPSTVLAQNDSGVGVKNGLNLGGVKNFLGTFAAPAAVLNDLALLRTLPTRDWIAGSAEAFKVALIRDRAFAEWLAQHAPAIPARDADVMAVLIRRCAELHVGHIMAGGDPFEQGQARPLDFGHWSAHKLETLSRHDLRHGEAVGLGIALDLLYAARLGFITQPEASRWLVALARAGLPLWHEVLAWCDPGGRPFVLCGIEEFREHLGGRLCLTLPGPIGARREIDRVDSGALAACLEQLRACARGGLAVAASGG